MASHHVNDRRCGRSPLFDQRAVEVTKDLTRREVLRVVFVGAAGVPFVALGKTAYAVDPSNTDTPQDAIIGTVISTTKDTLQLATTSAAVTLRPSPTARMYSGPYGQVRSAEAFIVGDRLVAQGVSTSDGFLASDVGSVYLPVTARITSVSSDGNSAETSVGPIQFDGIELPFTPASKQPVPPVLHPGDVLAGLVWTNPANGVKYLMIGG